MRIGQRRPPAFVFLLTLAHAAVASPHVATSGFLTTGTLATARQFFTATLLPAGDVLVAFGFGTAGTSTEIFRSASGTFAPAAGVGVPRSSHTATLLRNGKVLIAGGQGVSGPLATAMLYDPVTGSFGPTGSLLTARASHSATLLGDGNVLIVGGGGVAGGLTSAEIYDAATGTFAATGRLFTPRDRGFPNQTEHTATLLPNGTVLIAGGNDTSGRPMATAEIFDPATGTFTSTGQLAIARASHTATALPDGTVLIIGGASTSARAAEIYDPATGTFRAAGSLANARSFHTATLLPGGKVLVVAGFGFGPAIGALATAELYEPPGATSGGRFSSGGSLASARYGHTATLLAGGKVLIIAGSGTGMGPPLASAEIYEMAGPRRRTARH